MVFLIERDVLKEVLGVLPLVNQAFVTQETIEDQRLVR